MSQVRIKDYTGRRAGILTMIRFIEYQKCGRLSVATWEAICDCGRELRVPSMYFTHARHCGCIKYIRASAGDNEAAQQKAIEEYKARLTRDRDKILTENQRKRIDEALKKRESLQDNSTMTVENNKTTAEYPFRATFMLPCDQNEDYYY